MQEAEDIGILRGLKLPGDLLEVRRLLVDSLSQNEDVTAFCAALARLSPKSLGKLILGPDRIRDQRFIQSVLPVVHLIDGCMRTDLLYQALCLGAPDPNEVLEIAVSRFPAAGWLVQISGRFEQPAGLKHLQGTYEHICFPAICRAHARAGHTAALVEVSEGGRPEPAAQLLMAGERDAAIEATVRTLSHETGKMVIPYLIAIGGRGAEGVLLEVCKQLQDLALLQEITALVTPLPHVSAHLSAALGSPEARRQWEWQQRLAANNSGPDEHSQDL